MCVPGGTVIFVPSIQGYLSDRGTLDKQEVFGGCWLIFLLLHFLEERWLVFGRWYSFAILVTGLFCYR